MNKSKNRLSRSFSLFNRKSSNESRNSDTSSSPWKFWRRLSTRNRQDSKYLSSKERPEISLLERPDHLKTQDGQISPVSPFPSSGPLPDVVEKASEIPRFSYSSVPPPKPPRLFLVRTPSVVTRLSTENENDTDPMYMNSERVAELKSQRHEMPVNISRPNSSTSLSDCVKSGKPPELGENNNIVRQFSKTNSETEDNGVASIASKVPPSVTFRQNSTEALSLTSSTRSIPQSNLLNSVARKPKIKTPELHRKRPGRSFRCSNDKGETTRQKHIMNSISELLRQRLDPYPLLDQLKRAGFLTNVDVQSLIGHHDRKSVCEGIVGLVGDATPDALSLVCDLMSTSGNYVDILEVLQVMREMDRIIHDVSYNTNIESSSLSDEKTFSFDIGYLAPDYSLKPLVELDKVRANNDKRLSKASSRNSSHSLLETFNGDHFRNGDCSLFPGLIMMSICVTGHSLSGQRSEALANVINKHNCISELHIGKTQLSGEDVCVIAKALEDNRTIHFLDLRLNNMGHTGTIAITDLLSKTKSLQLLNLSSCSLDLTIFKNLVAAIASNKSLTDLDLSFLDITDECCDCLRDMLKANTILQKLRLRSNMLSWSGCYVLAEGLVRNMSLSVLDLSRNTIDNDGAQAIAKFLPESCVTEVCLENCGITSVGCDALAELVTRCKKLKNLDISNNALQDIGISKLAPALERTSSLETLGLNMCGVTNDGFSKLLDVLEKNTSIVHMKLCYNKLGQEQFDPSATSENLRYRLRIVTSSKPKLQILLWGNSFEDS
uniref:CARD domain-containing protein n=1 Tax=Arion vulgaris TaxID=1028688 RepID=A0A0B7A3V8_9EUPU